MTPIANYSAIIQSAYSNEPSLGGTNEWLRAHEQVADIVQLLQSGTSCLNYPYWNHG